jgi:hypothetical protein
MKKAAKLLLASAILCSGLRASLVTLDLSPSGDIYGNPGDTIGWGFSLTNSTSYYLVVSGSLFNPTSGDVSGTYTDYIGAAFIAVGPGATLSQNFDSVAQTGVGAFAIDPSAIPAASAAGYLTITYDLFGEDPTNPNPDLVTYPNFPDQLDCPFPDNCTLSPFASVSAYIPPPSPTPEPATLTMIGVGLLCFGFLRRRRARG